jgi:hypothetical protein
MATTTAPQQLGFLTVLNEQNAYLGGYLVVNIWGRPLEFRLTSAVQPNRVQQILYGPTLANYVCSDLIGKTLVDKTGLPIQLIVTDTEAALDLRLKLDVPVVLAARDGDNLPGIAVRDRQERRAALRSHAHYPQEVEAIRELIVGVEQHLDLAEPFARIREAIVEARRTGVASRAA